MANCSTPVNLAASSGKDKINLSWSKKINEHFVDLSGFTVTKNSGNETATVSGGVCTITIPNGTGEQLKLKYNTPLVQDYCVECSFDNYSPNDYDDGLRVMFEVADDSYDNVFRIHIEYDQRYSGSNDYKIMLYRKTNGSSFYGIASEYIDSFPTKLIIIMNGSVAYGRYIYSGGSSTVGSYNFGSYATEMNYVDIFVVDNLARGGSVDVSELVENIDIYNLYWSNNSGVTVETGTKIAAIEGTIYEHSGLNPGFYYYIITGENELGESTASSEVSAQSYGNFPGISPTRTLTIGNSDYSTDVIKWPTISRTTNQLKSVDAKFSLKNTSGSLNNWYNIFYTKQETVQLKYQEWPSNSEYIIYSGWVYDIQYKNRQCHVKCKDRLADLLSRKVGTDTDPASWGAVIPSDIAWDICTSYSGMSSVQDSSNPDIDYEFFEQWSSVFSRDNITQGALFKGEKASKALESLSEMTNSDIWCDRDGKIKFKAKVEISSDYAVVTENDIFDLDLSIETGKLINKQYIYAAYSQTSNYHSVVVYHQNDASVNSYGLFEDVREDTKIWMTNSQMAINLAQKIVALFKEPPKTFNIKVPTQFMNITIGDKIRLVDSFFSITSLSAWRIVGEKFNMNEGSIEYELGGARAFSPFQLDVSVLDGTDVLI